MNSSFLPNHRSLSILTPRPGQGLLDRLRSLFCLALCVLGLPASAQNLVVNGDFEAGQIAPWQGGELFANPAGGLCGRIGDPRLGEMLSQTVSTIPDQRYLLSGELRSENEFPSVCNVLVQGQGGSIEGARDAFAPAGAFHRFTLPFTASSASTFLYLSSSGVGDYVLIDNVSLTPVPPGAGGLYAGTIVTTVTVTDPALSAKSSRKVTARMNQDRELVLLDGTDGIMTGYILSSGEFSLSLPDGSTVTGTAVVRGRRITLEYITGSHAAVTPSGASVPNTIKQVVVLTRR